MRMRLSYRQQPNYLAVKASGDWTTDSAEQAIEAIHDEAVRRSFTRLLLDIRGLSQPPNELTRFFTGERLARTLGFPFKLGFLTRPDLHGRFTEIAARNRGADLAVFFEEESAVEWLLEGADRAGAGDV